MRAKDGLLNICTGGSAMPLNRPYKLHAPLSPSSGGGRTQRFFLELFRAFTVSAGFARILSISVALAFPLAGCNATWNEPIGEWFECYTNEASIDRHEFSVPTYSNKNDGNTCIGTDADSTVTFYLHNPKG